MLNTSGVKGHSLIHYKPQHMEPQLDRDRSGVYVHIVPGTASVGCLTQRRRTGNSNGGKLFMDSQGLPLLSPPLHPALSASTLLSPRLSTESTNFPLG